MTGRHGVNPVCLGVLLMACDPSRGNVIVSQCQTVHVDPFQERALQPGDSSHWLQPWRAYLDTWPARRMREAPLFLVDPVAKSAIRVQQYANAGVRRALVHTQWENLSDSSPATLPDGHDDRKAFVGVLRDQGVRPVVLVDAFHNLPGKDVSLNLTAAAVKGTTQLRLDSASVDKVVAGRTLLQSQEVFITSVTAAGLAKLSRPLSDALGAGSVDFTNVMALPFARPTLPDGRPNSGYAESLRVWIDYVGAASRETQAALGTDNFDLQVSLGAGSPVWDINNYFDPPLYDGSSVEQNVRQILDQTVRYVRDASNGLSGVTVIDGFSGRQWASAGAQEVAGVGYYGRDLTARRFVVPLSATATDRPTRWIDATGNPNGQRQPDGVWHEAFTPSYTVMFPEVYLTAVSTIQLTPDLGPEIWRDATGTPHSRGAGPDGGSPPGMFIQSFSMTLGRPANETGPGLTSDETRRMVTKTTLRALAAYVGKGAAALAFYVGQPDWDLIAGDTDGGETLVALKRFLAAFEGPAQLGAPRSVTLQTVVDCTDARQFDGDGTAAHPPLYNRDVVAFFPFQVNDSRFVIPAYVMTRDLGQSQAGAPSRYRQDLPAQPYSLVIRGVKGAQAVVTSLEPVTGTITDVPVTRRWSDQIRIQVPLTDSPRLLQINEP